MFFLFVVALAAVFEEVFDGGDGTAYQYYDESLAVVAAWSGALVFACWWGE